jgi:phage FluMu protein Com
MNLRCTYCQTPFAIGRLEKLAAIQKMQAEDLHHYDVFCPRCRRANSVSRQRLEIFTPGWQEGLKTLEAEAAQIEKERQAPVPAALAEAKPAAVETRRRHSPRPAPAAPTRAESTPKAKKAPSKAAPATKSKADAKKPAAKPAAKAKPVAKPAAKKSTAKPAAKKTVKKK